MSISIHEVIRSTQERVDYLAAAVARFPNVRVDQMWDGGPLVPVLPERPAAGLKAKAAIVMQDKEPVFLLYVLAGDGCPVYLDDHKFSKARASSVLNDMDPDEMQMLVAAIRRRS